MPVFSGRPVPISSVVPSTSSLLDPLPSSNLAPPSTLEKPFRTKRLQKHPQHGQELYKKLDFSELEGNVRPWD
eukprot:8795424-Pyramimonas_sp.AAC.1